MMFNSIKKYLLLAVFIVFFSMFAPTAVFSDNNKTILLLPFKYEGNPANSWVATGIYDFLDRSIRTNNALRLIPAATAVRIENIVKVNNTPPLTPETIQKLISISGADTAISMNISISDNSVHLTYEEFMSSGELKRNYSLTESISRIYDIEEAIYRSILNKETPVINKLPMIKTKVNKKWVTVQKSPPSIEPFEWYSKALESLRNNPDAAISLLVKTLRYDPENTSALIAASNIVQEYQNNVDGALGYLLRAEKIFIKRGETSNSRYSGLMLRIGSLYSQKSNKEKQPFYIARAMESWKKRKTTQPVEYASFLADVGLLYFNNNDFNSALDYFNSAREQYITNNANKSIYYAWLLQNIGESYLALKNPSLSINYLSEAERFYRDSSFDNNESYAMLLFSQGKAVYQQGNIKDASQLLDKSRSILLSENSNVKAAEVLRFKLEMKNPANKKIN